MNSDKLLPQHDLDERNTLGRYEITDKGRRARACAVKWNEQGVACDANDEPVERYEAHEILWGGIPHRLTLPELQRFIDQKYRAIYNAYHYPDAEGEALEKALI